MTGNRATDKSFVRWLWENYAIYFHTVGFIVLVIFMSGNYWSKWQAQAADIEDLKLRTTKLELASIQVIQRLDDIIAYLKVPRRDENYGKP